ncbi:hypothetical protein HWV62_19627 [Athelia sp. TMB]|nr:hypothetical protein HWV62_19627 [Athelia sp. TMB]
MDAVSNPEEIRPTGNELVLSPALNHPSPHSSSPHDSPAGYALQDDDIDLQDFNEMARLEIEGEREYNLDRQPPKQTYVDHKPRSRRRHNDNVHTGSDVPSFNAQVVPVSLEDTIVNIINNPYIPDFDVEHAPIGIAENLIVSPRKDTSAGGAPLDAVAALLHGDGLANIPRAPGQFTSGWDLAGLIPNISGPSTPCDPLPPGYYYNPPALDL